MGCKRQRGNGHLLDTLEIRENPQTVKNKGQSNHFLDFIRDSRDFIKDFIRDSSSEKRKDPFRNDPFFRPVPKVVQENAPIILFILMGRFARTLLSRTLEVFCLDQFCVFQGKVHTQSFSNTSFG